MDEREEQIENHWRLSQLATHIFIGMKNTCDIQWAVATATEIMRLSAKAIADEKERISKEEG